MSIDHDPFPTAGPDKLTRRKPLVNVHALSLQQFSEFLFECGAPPGIARALHDLDALGSQLPDNVFIGFALLDNNEACLAPDIREGDPVDHERFFVRGRSIRRSRHPQTIGIGGTCVGKPQQERESGGIAPIDLLVIGLIEVGKDTAVASGDTFRPADLGQTARILLRFAEAGRIVVHDLKRASGDLHETVIPTHKLRQCASAALRRLIEQECVSFVGARCRLDEDLALFQLEYSLDAARQRMLDRGERSPAFGSELGEPAPGETKQERILAVFYQRNDKLAQRIGPAVVGAVFFLLADPRAGFGIDEEADLLLVLAPPQPLVDPADPRGLCKIQRCDFPFGIADDLVGRGPGALERKGCLKLEPLPLPVLVVRCDPLGRPGADILDPIEIVNEDHPAERRSADMAHLGVFPGVSRATGLANRPALRRQHAVGAVAGIFEERAVHAERAALMVDEALRAELGNRKKPGALDVALVLAVRNFPGRRP